MDKSQTILADSLAIFDHMAAFDIAFKQWLDEVDLGKLLVYSIDNVDADALPALAKQFDVLGYKGMRLAQTEQDQRNLIKRAIELHRYKGTIWAVKEAMKAVGFKDLTLIEHVDGHWAKFRVVLLNENVGITASSITDLIAMINEYKNTRSLLVDVRIDILVSDEIDISEDDADVSEEIKDSDNVSFTGSLLYDGAADYDGLFDHSGDSDLVTITLIP